MRRAEIITKEEYDNEAAALAYMEECYEFGYSCRKLEIGQSWIVEVWGWV